MKPPTKTRDIQKLKASDIMRKNVLTIQEDAPIEKLIDLLADHHILGVPVVDKKGHLKGVVSVSDLVRRESDTEAGPGSAFYHDYYPEIDVWENPPAPAQLQRRVCDIMSSPPITASPDDPLPKLAKAMRKHHIHRIIIAQDKAILGLVTTMDILGVMG